MYAQRRLPQNSVVIKHMYKQCVPGAPSPLLRAWEWGYARDSHMVAVYEWSRSHFWNVKGLKARAFARHQYSLLFQQIEVNFTVDITHCASIFCLPDTTWCHCMWRDLPGLHLSKYWRQWRPEKEAKMDSSHTLKVCNLMKGRGFLLLSVDWAPLTLFFTFFVGRPITVTSWPFGRPRLWRIGGMLISEYMCAVC